MTTMDYKQAGVNIDAGNEAVRRLRAFIPNIGSFSGLFPLDITGYQAPYLVAATDGVGTKLKIACALNQHDTVGIDLVAMSVNDLLCCGAKPLFFLDYIGCQKVIPDQIAALVQGVATGCEQAGCTLIGGETAELHDMYAPGEYDLAGFAVGLVDKQKIINGHRIQSGDQLIGLPATGIHSNGLTLARKVLPQTDYPALLVPTKIYVKEVHTLLENGVQIKGIAHITGGGLIENVPRILPAGCQMKLYYGSWPIPEIFKKIQQQGQITNSEMYRVFNMGIGLVLVVSRKELPKIADPLVIGEIINA
jgi:phosphoribosylformylglycinamidine cyclo-ligase